ncbi:MAG: hypothetical protein ACXVVK_22090 [Solirubrobacteraceae bacterium]
MNDAPRRRRLDVPLPGFGLNEVSYRARYLLNAYPASYTVLGRWRHPRRHDYYVRRDTELVIEGFGRAGNTFAWLAFRSAQPRPVRLAHHTHAAAQVITAARWNIPTLVIVRPPDDSALAHMVLRGVSARSALVAWIRYHRRIMTVRHGFVAAAFDDVTHAYGAVLRGVNEAFATTFGVFEHTAENQARVFDEISERNRLLRGEQMTRRRALWLARPTPERDLLKDRHRGELETGALAPLRARADRLHAAILRTEERKPGADHGRSGHRLRPIRMHEPW